jgi:hypothetical protein
MSAVIAIDTSELNRSLERLQAATKRDFGGIVRQVARLLAGNLIHDTQPYGTELAAKKQGEGAVMRDIGKVFMTASQAYRQIQELDKKLAAGWYKAVKAGDFAKAEKMIEKSTLPFRNAEISATLDPQLHQSNRQGRGRVYRQRPAAILSDPKELKDYAKKVAQRVGFGKAGWASAASNIGNATMGRLGRIPAWVTRHKGAAPGAAQDRSKGTDPSVMLTNQVRYASDLRGMAASQAASQKIMAEKMIAYVEYVIAGEARKAGFQSRTTQPAESPPQ